MIYLTFFLLVWIGCAFFCGEVAKEKGYGGTSWFIGGLFFGIFALIASAGLPDRKLRRYIRLIGEKQNAIEVIKENKQLQLVDVLKSGGCKLEEYNIKSYDFFESALGSKEFIVNSEKQDSLIILNGKEKGNQITWLGKI